MKRKISMLIALIITVALFVSCTGGSYTVTIGNLSGSSTSLKGNYNSFNGRYYSRVKLEEGDIVEYKASCNTDSGSLKLVLLDKQKNVLANLLEADSIEISKDGYYYFTALGDHHKGNFDVEWNIN